VTVGVNAAAVSGVNAGDTAWMLAATALVLMMTPALGLFYAGLVRAKNTLNTFMMSIAALGVVTVTWAIVGYSFAFDKGNGFIGGFKFAFLHEVTFAPRAGTAIPHLLFTVFEATFCIITAALVSGAVVERMRFGSFLAFIVIWSIAIYPVLAYWVFGGGWLQAHGTLDFAGGVPVEMGSGFSAFAAAKVVGARKDYGRQALLPHNAVYALLGAGLLWFGWFGFNGGSGYSTGHSSVLAFTNTLLAPACTLVVWFGLDLLTGRRVTAIGAATAIVVGCVGITPACGYVSPTWAIWTSRPAWPAGAGGGRGSGLCVLRHLRDPAPARAGHAPAGQRGRGGPRDGHRSARGGGLRDRRGRDSGRLRAWSRNRPRKTVTA